MKLEEQCPKRSEIDDLEEGFAEALGKIVSEYNTNFLSLEDSSR